MGYCKHNKEMRVLALSYKIHQSWVILLLKQISAASKPDAQPCYIRIQTCLLADKSSQVICCERLLAQMGCGSKGDQ